MVYQPIQIFDDLYYVGSSFVGATILKTPQGLILIDTLKDSADAASILESGMKTLGLDPAQIKYVVVTHGHGDHYGGLDYLRKRYPGFKIVMTRADWAYSAGPIKLPGGGIDPAPAPPRQPGDVEFSGSYVVELGGVQVKLFETPGHTPGTTSLIYTVHDRGKAYNVMQWGGGDPVSAAFSLPTVQSYMTAAKAAHVAVQWSSHARPGWPAKFDQRRAAGTGPNPFIDGEARLGRYADLVTTCKSALVAEGAQPGVGNTP